MAIINSMGVGRSRKSMGNVTYRTVRGRTIGSQKVTPKPDAATKGSVSQLYRRVVFGLISRFMAVHGDDIDLSFNKTKYGSERNYFMRVNYNGLREALSSLNEEATDAAIEAAITSYVSSNGTSIYRVKRSGYPIQYLTKAWSSADNPIQIQVSLAGTPLTAGNDAPQMSTGEAFQIINAKLDGEVSLVTSDSLGGATSEYAQSAAFTSISVTGSQFNAKIAAALNEKYLVAVKVGEDTIIQMKNESSGLPLG